MLPADFAMKRMRLRATAQSKRLLAPAWLTDMRSRTTNDQTEGYCRRVGLKWYWWTSNNWLTSRKLMDRSSETVASVLAWRNVAQSERLLNGLQCFCLHERFGQSNCQRTRQRTHRGRPTGKNRTALFTWTNSFDYQSVTTSFNLRVTTTYERFY